MSNSYSTTTLLCDPSDVVAGRSATFETPLRMANATNYAYAAGGCHNALSQSFADRVFIQDSGFFTEMAQWRIPLVSLDHDELEILVHYRTHGSGNNSQIKLTLDAGTASASTTITLSSTLSGLANDTITITYPSATSLYYATLTMEARGDTANNTEVELFSIMAYWKRIDSPISAGKKRVYGSGIQVTPFGTGRTSANQALTSRFAHNMIDNIDETRKRLTTIASWSGVYSPNSSQYPQAIDAATSQIYIGVGDINTFLCFPLLPAGFEELDFTKLELHVRAIGDVSFTFFGNNIVINQASNTTVGWTRFDLDIDNANLSQFGDTNLPYYYATFDPVETNQENLISLSNYRSRRYPPAVASPSLTTEGTIIGLTLMGL